MRTINFSVKSFLSYSMPGRNKALAALAVTVVSVAAVLFASTYGTVSRNWPSYLVIIEAPSAKDLYRVWKGSGAKGLKVVNISSFFSYMNLDNTFEATRVTSDGKVPYRDMSELLSSSVDHTNYLWAAQESGIVRNIDHIFPVAGFDILADSVRKVSGVAVGKASIELSDYGTHRLITTMHIGKGDPVILNIDASYFEDAQLADLLSVIECEDLNPALVTLYFAEDSPDVNEQSREALRAAVPEIRKRFQREAVPLTVKAAVTMIRKKFL